ncbi:MAG: hypothetical protein Q4P18_05060 [Methanobrevibacter sp.]|nr:hypothetical protein [Methanobrevibacter sp.]
MSSMVLFAASNSLAEDVDEIGENAMDNLEIIEENSQQLNVKSNNIGTFQDIQNAINGAKNGDKIILDKEEYVGNGQTINLDKSVSIVGKEGMKPILNGNNLERILRIGGNGDNLTIENCEFINGYCPNSGGGAIYILGSDVEIINCVFRENEAKAGGAVYGDYVRVAVPDAGDNTKVINCTFSNNFAYTAAGALGLYGLNNEVIGCIFDSNEVNNRKGNMAETFGGALQLGKDEIKTNSKCINSLFTNNSAISIFPEFYSHGGAGCVRDGVEYRNCTFISNKASQGGALTYHSSGIISDCVFINNSAFELYGGALNTGYLTSNMNLSIINSIFDGNSAPQGGACFLNGEFVCFDNCSLKNNIATHEGGAIFIKAKSTSIEDCLFDDNIAYMNGGALYINADLTNIQNNQFYNNEATPHFFKIIDGLGGAIYINSINAVIDDNSFRYNVARNGSAIYIDENADKIIINNNEMCENQAWVYRLSISAPENPILYGEDVELNSVIYGGNNIANCSNIGVSNAIYNAANVHNIVIDGANPVMGATNSGKLYQDDREFNTNILLTVVHEDGSVVYNDTLYSDVDGKASINLKKLNAGNYNVYSTHIEDNYYKGISNQTTFTIIPNADVQISKIANNSQYNYKDLVLWNLTIKNRGPSNATEVVINDLLPEGLVWVWDNSEGQYNPETGVLSLSKLDDGTGMNLIIVTQINKTGNLVNHANISSNEYDYDLENNDASESIYVNPAADLWINETISNPNPSFGDEITISIKVGNDGPDDATGVVVSDLIPDGLVWVSDDGEGSFDAGVWDVGVLSVGETRTLAIVCRVNKTGQFANDVDVFGNEYDHDLTNNNDSKSIHVDKTVDLWINETVTNLNPNFKGELTIIIEVGNDGPDDATGVVVSDLIPDGLVWVSDDGEGSFDAGVWDVGVLSVGETRTLAIVCRVNKTGQFANDVEVNGNEHDLDLTNNFDSKTIDVAPAADLSIVKTVDNKRPDYGDVVKWTIKVKNNGPDSANNVKVAEKLSEGLMIINYDSTSGNYDVDSGIWNVNSIEPGCSEFLNVYCKVIKTGNIKNDVSVIADEYDNDLTNNKHSESVSSQPTVDLAVEILANNSNPDYKQKVLLTLIATNNGPDDATGVSVAYNIPDGLILVGSDGDFDNGLWNIGNLKVGENKILNLEFSVNKTGDIINHGVISGNEFETNLENNNGLNTLHVRPAVDLDISKSASKLTYSIGEFIEYIVKVKNNGPDNAHNVVVEDIMDQYMLFSSYSADVGIFENNGNLWHVDELENNQSATLIFKALAQNAGIVLNKAVVSSDDFDFDEFNNCVELGVSIENLMENVSNKTSEILYSNSDNPCGHLMENPAAKAYLSHLELEKTGSPIMILIMSIIILIPFGFGYFSRK